MSCDEARGLAAKWIEWCEKRQVNKAKLEEIRNIKARIKQFEEDEEWKAKVLRLVAAHSINTDCIKRTCDVAQGAKK